MTIYLDTSLVVAALVQETATKRVHAWLERQIAGSLFISDWTITECASALAIKMRQVELTLEQRAEVQIAWTLLRRDSLIVLPIAPEIFVAASGFIDRAPGLRAGDALHLAVGAANGCRIASLDNVQTSAAPACGVPVELT